jgi:hypothetical protein
MAGRDLFAPTEEDQSTGRDLLAPKGFGTTGMDLSPQKSEQSFIGGLAQQGMQGATLGFADEGQAALGAAYAKVIDFFDQNPVLSDKSFAQVMTDIRAQIRAENEKFAKENPLASTGAQVAGGLATGGIFGGGKIAGAKTMQQAAVQGAKVGAATGLAAGAGFADADDFFSQETLEEAIKTGVLGTALGALTPAMIQQAIKAGKAIPKALPESLMETAVKIRPSVEQGKRASMIRTALDEGIMPTTNGLELISKKLTNLDRGLDKIIDGATERGVLISKKALFSELRKLRKDLGGVNLRASKNIKQIDAIAKAFDENLKKINKSMLTPREVQDLKRSAYRQLRFDVSQQSASFATTETEKGIIRGAKKSLEKIGPDVEKINLREGKLLELGDELERAVGRLDNRNLISLDTAAKIAAGAATGSPAGTGVGVGASVLGAPRVKARTALILENIRKMGEISESVNKSLPPEAAAAFAILVEDNKESLSELIE